ncbi:MAG: outer membrane beta-barrel family protein [Muribaculaceae bacterium]|nr:outer membrane beta-barrel family protein [Muribaculaceae bacterium]
MTDNRVSLLLRITVSIIFMGVGMISQAGSQVVTGRVYSASDSSALRVYTIEIAEGPDTAPVMTRDVTDGPCFSAECPGSICRLTIIADGYREHPVTVTHDTIDTDLGDIYLEPHDAIELKDVEVSGPAMVTKQDRMVFFVDSNEAKASVSVSDLISRLRIPGAMVDLVSGAVTVGGGSVAYEVDNVPRDFSYVRTISPDKVKRIEVSDHPTGRYTGTGVGNVIFIYLKEPSEGGSLYDNLQSFLTRENLQNDLNVSYNQGKSEFSLLYNFALQNDYRYLYEGEQRYRGASASVDISEISRRRTIKCTTNRIGLDWTYRMDAGTMLIVEATTRIYRDSYSMATDNSRRVVSPAQSGDISYTAVENTANRISTPSVDVYFSHEGEDYSINADVKGSLGEATNDWSNSELFSDGQEHSFTNYGTNRTSSLSAEVEYRRGRPDGFLAFTARNVYTGARSEYRTPAQSVARQASNVSWLSASRLWSRSGRYLLAMAGGTLHTFSNGATHHVSAMPNAMLRGQYEVRKSQLSAEINYNTAYPTLAETDSTVLRSGEYLYRRGNPDLRSANSLSGQLNYSLYDQRWSVRAYASYATDIHRIINVYAVEDDRYMMMPVNALSCDRISLYGSASFTLRRGHIRCTVGGSVRATDYRTRIPSGDRVSVFGVSCTPYVALYHDKGVALSVVYASPNKSLDGITEIRWGRNLQMQASYTLKGLSVYLLADCLGVRSGTSLRQTVHSPVVWSGSYAEGRQQANGFCIGASYRINFGRVFRKPQKNINQPDAEPTHMILDSGR